MLQLILSNPNVLQAWRNKYFDSLSYSQDMYSESMISWNPTANFYIINNNGKQIGYAILNNSRELVEFYIQNAQITQKEYIFSEVIRKLNVKNVYCKSFDQILLSCCYKFSNSSKMVGYLFQDYNLQSDIELDISINVRLATTDDITFLNSFENELLEEGETIDAYIKSNNVYIFKKADNELIGCGYLFNVIPGRKYYDLGMWVNQSFRKKGYGTQIISYLMKYCFENGFIPTAGCEESNLASRRTLEKCGFVSKLCLINFQL